MKQGKLVHFINKLAKKQLAIGKGKKSAHIQLHLPTAFCQLPTFFTTEHFDKLTSTGLLRPAQNSAVRHNAPQFTPLKI